MAALRYLWRVKSSVTIVVPCLNEAAYIERCIESVLGQDYGVASIELLVVDGMSIDGTREILFRRAATDATLRVIDNPSRFTPIALNKGAQAARGDVVIILGAHAELHPEFVSRSIESLEAHPDAGCVGGLIQNIHENKESELIGLAMASVFGVGNARFRTGGKAGYVDTVAFGAYRKTVFERIGWFDEALVRNQDDEFNFRLTKAGFKIWFDPEIRTKYYVRGSFKKLYRQYFQYGYWKVYVNRKHRTVTTIRQVIPLLFVAWVCFSLVLTLVDSRLMPLFTLPLFLWFIAAFGAALMAATPSKDLPGVIRAFLTLHVAYGLGYAKGLVDFVLRNRKPAPSEHTITR